MDQTTIHIDKDLGAMDQTTVHIDKLETDFGTIEIWVKKFWQDFIDIIFKCIFLKEKKVYILIEISLNFIRKGSTQECWDTSRYQAQRQVNASHRYCEM